MSWRCERPPVERGVLGGMTGDQGHAVREAAMGEGDLRHGGGGERRGDARHHDVRNVVGGQEFDLLAAAPEDEGIATLEPCDALARGGKVQQELVNALLLRVIANRLADGNALGVPTRTLQDRIRNQSVVEDDIGLLQCMEEVLLDLPKAAALGQKASERAMELFDEGLMVRRHFLLYEGIASCEK